ncbi:hypothetical protein OG883_44635 [Streptomyces sp. NBC_01142]|uniref:hypothetical protein n=1 Tax=Streptomyces sp. NBC_01142 TaxID=2975865 RepID=UPI0022502A81|nr:hypothetical protein [Streptomyces sp. NBC_01142]MCX4826733.1 hypothetical protein [Streptomyces sp. NBC_01142]
MAGRTDFPTRIGEPAIKALAALLRGDERVEPEQAEEHARRILATAVGIGYRHGAEAGYLEGLSAGAKREQEEE